MLQEIRYALRLIFRSPGFTAIAALSLALGIGANAAIFSLADALLFRPLPVEGPGSVMAVSLDTGGGPGGGSYPDYRDLRASQKSFDGLVGFEFSTFSMARTTAETPQLKLGALVSDNFFSVLGVKAVLGRDFLLEETARGGAPAVILTDVFWQDQFNGDRNI